MSNQKSAKQFFAPPVFPEDEEKTRRAKYANAIALTFIVIVFGYEIILPIILWNFSVGVSDLILVLLTIVILASWILLKRGYLQLASIILVVTTWVACNGIAASGVGIRDSA